MHPLKLDAILNGIDIIEIHGNCDTDIDHITNNSRQCKEGSLFVAVRGYQTDGHKYVKSAVENGAVEAFTEAS